MAEESKYPHFSVTSLTSAVKGSLEKGFSRIVVEGEISGWKRYPSGHCYFTLKDEGAQISAVMFSSYFERSGAKAGLRDGAKVAVFGNLTVYAQRGNYQLSVFSVRLSGLGDLMQKYLLLKEKLEKEGLFDASRKRAIPFAPRRIALVTSEAGAVVHDMCNVISRRFPAVEIRLSPSLVQGADAPRSLISSLEYFNSSDWKADVLIIARGGGSFEDLFCFNDESLVRAVASSRIPVISAVGHETDFTLCDFAADVRAGTPSIAAEMAVPVLDELKRRVLDFTVKMSASLRAKVDIASQRLDQTHDSLFSLLHIASERTVRRVEIFSARIEQAFSLSLQSAESRLSKAEAKIEAYSPYGVLERGYSITTRQNGEIVRDASLLKEGERLRTRLRDGTVESVVASSAKI